MYTDLEMIANLEFGKAIERISAETQQKLQSLITGMPRGGQMEATRLEIQLHQAEETCQVYAQIWLDLLEAKNGGHLERENVTFIVSKIQEVAAGRKNSLMSGPNHSHLPSAAGEIGRRLDGIVASIRRDLEIHIRKQDALPKKVPMAKSGVRHINVNVDGALNESSELDDLLPLYRRRIFDADLVRLSKEALENGCSLVMIMIDLDHFKAINDTHGHAIGDEVLISASKVVADRVRGKGRAYRYGGEEFALLLPNYTSDEGVALAETIRKQIEQSAFSVMKLKVTASLGLAAVPANANNSSEVLKAADAAMYEAKNLGRNLVRVFGEQKPAQGERTPDRKSPAPGAMSDDDREHIRTAYFNGRQPECPSDGCRLRILKEFHEVGRRTPTILIMCPLCGLQEIIHGLG
jgi:diguanylate cyclase (GGDEF)-like protein